MSILWRGNDLDLGLDLGLALDLALVDARIVSLVDALELAQRLQSKQLESATGVTSQ